MGTKRLDTKRCYCSVSIVNKIDFLIGPILLKQPFRIGGITDGVTITHITMPCLYQVQLKDHMHKFSMSPPRAKKTAIVVPLDITVIVINNILYAKVGSSVKLNPRSLNSTNMSNLATIIFNTTNIKFILSETNPPKRL